MAERQRVILDIDGGIDAAVALMYCLLAPGIALEAVTTSGEADGVRAAEAAKQALSLARLCAPDREPPPVAVGADRPPRREADGGLYGAGAAAAPAGGRGRLGGALLPPADAQPLAEPAAALLASRAAERPGELALVFAGPATNWPPALAQAPQLARQLRQVVAAGGAVMAPGDATPVAEANFRGDPRAADELLRTAPSVTAVGLDASAKLAAATDLLERVAPLVPPQRERAFTLLRRLLEHRARHAPPHAGVPLGLAPLPGAAAVLALAAPQHFAFRVWPAAVACEGELTAGMVVADRRREPSLAGAQPVRFAMDVDAEAALQTFLAAWAR